MHDQERMRFLQHSTLIHQKKRKTRSWSLVPSPIPQLDGDDKHVSSKSEIESDPEPETNPNPKPGDAKESDTEPEPSPRSESDPLPLTNMNNPMFGYCYYKKCRLCQVRTTEKVENYYHRSTFAVLVCTVSPGHWVNEEDTSRCNKVDAVRLRLNFTKWSEVCAMLFYNFSAVFRLYSGILKRKSAKRIMI